MVALHGYAVAILGVVLILKAKDLDRWVECPMCKEHKGFDPWKPDKQYQCRRCKGTGLINRYQNGPENEVVIYEEMAYNGALYTHTIMAHEIDENDEYMVRKFDGVKKGTSFDERFKQFSCGSAAVENCKKEHDRTMEKAVRRWVQEGIVPWSESEDDKK